MPVSSTPALIGEPQRRRHLTADEKAGYVAQFSESGLSQAEFCRQMDLPAPSFSAWRRRAGAAAPSQPEFAEVRVTELPRRASVARPIAVPAVVIRLPGGTQLEATAGTDPRWLGQLLKALVAG